MKARLSGFLFVLILLVVFGLGVFLLVAADEMPAPGLILMAISGVSLIRYGFNRAQHIPDKKGTPFDATERDRESYEHEAERRRRDESDADTQSNSHNSRFE